MTDDLLQKLWKPEDRRMKFLNDARIDKQATLPNFEFYIQ